MTLDFPGKTPSSSILLHLKAQNVSDFYCKSTFGSSPYHSSTLGNLTSLFLHSVGGSDHHSSFPFQDCQIYKKNQLYCLYFLCRWADDDDFFVDGGLEAELSLVVIGQTCQVEETHKDTNKTLTKYQLKHRKNCECCPVSQLIVR